MVIQLSKTPDPVFSFYILGHVYLRIMVQFFNFAIAAATTVLVSNVIAHPGEVHVEEHVKREIALRDMIASHSRRSLGNCENSAAAKELKERAIERRAVTAEALRKKRGIDTKS
jgi:hypothetical protein